MEWEAFSPAERICMRSQLVAIYGDSLMLAAMEVALRSLPSVMLLRVSPGREGLEILDHVQPTAILFDLTAPEAGFAIAFLRDHPGSRLIGLDLEQDAALVFSGETHTVATTGDLAQIVSANK
jgi:hypothetical protein